MSTTAFADSLVAGFPGEELPPRLRQLLTSALKGPKHLQITVNSSADAVFDALEHLTSVPMLYCNGTETFTNVTDWVKRARLAKGVNLPKDNYTYIALRDDRFPELHYFEAFTKDKDYLHYYQLAREQLISGTVLALSDKVSQLKFMQEDQTSLFPSRRYLDLRRLNFKNRYGLHCFSNINFRNFPIQKISDAVRHNRNTVAVFEDADEGFAVTTKEGNISVTTKNQKYRAVWSSLKKETDPVKRFEKFLESLSSVTHSFFKVRIPYPEHTMRLNKHGTRAANELDVWASMTNDSYDRVVQAILKNPGGLYLKPTDTANGIWIIHIIDQDGEKVLGSDSQEYWKFLETMRAVQRAARANLPFFEDLKAKFPNLPDVFDDEYKNWKQVAERTSETTENILRVLLHTVPNAVLEEELPAIKVDGLRVEFRLIFQQLPDSSLQLTAHYAKVSDKEHVANLSHGGWGADTLEMLERIYRSILEVPEIESQKAANEALSKLLVSATEIAKRYATENGGLKEFAIDVMPILDGTTDGADLSIAFPIIEFQNGFACQGLKSINELLYEVVMQNRQVIRETKRNRTLKVQQ